MTETQKKQKEISVAFARHYVSDYGKVSTPISYEKWLLTEEGKRLTAEEPAQEPTETVMDALTKMAQYMMHLSEHQLVIKHQLDRIEGSMKFQPKE